MHRYQSEIVLTLLSVSFFATPESAQGGDCSSGVSPGTSAWSENLLINPSAETGDLTGWSAEPDFTVSSGAPGAFDGTYFFSAGYGEQHTLRQSVDLLALGFDPDGIDGGALLVHAGGRQQSWPQTPADTGQIVIDFLNADSVVVESFVGPVLKPLLGWALVEDQRTLPAGTRFIEFSFTAIRYKGSKNDGFLDGTFVRLSDDCNANGEPDACDVADGVSADVNTNGVPDACEPDDADGDGVLDVLDVCEGHDDTLDADADGVPDGCDDCTDVDGDGLCGAEDACPESDVSTTVVIGQDCDTGLENVWFADGCTLADHINAIAFDADTFRAFYRGISTLGKTLKREGFLTVRQANKLRRCARRVSDWRPAIVPDVFAAPLTITVKDCDTRVEDFKVDDEMVSTYIAHFADDARNRGEFVSSVWVWSRTLRREGRLTVDDIWALTHCVKDNRGHNKD